MSRIYWDTMLFISSARRPSAIRQAGGRDPRSHGTAWETNSSPAPSPSERYRPALTAKARPRLPRSRDGCCRKSSPRSFLFTIETADHYAQIRGALGVAPADAIHLASAAPPVPSVPDERQTACGQDCAGDSVHCFAGNAIVVSAYLVSKTAKRADWRRAITHNCLGYYGVHI